MPARWDALPSKARAQVPRQPVLRGVWRCEGVRGCGEVIDDTWAAAERHSDEHHGSRLAVVFGAQRDTVISPTTEENSMSDLGEFQGRQITKITIALRGAGDGLSQALKVEPQNFIQGQTVYVLMETVVGPIKFKPLGELEEECTPDLLCQAATIIDRDAVPEALDRTKELIQRRKESDAGVQRLPTDEELHGEHYLGLHESHVEGCIECEQRAAAGGDE